MKQGSRLVISDITLDNFKSFKGTNIIGPLN